MRCKPYGVLIDDAEQSFFVRVGRRDVNLRETRAYVGREVLFADVRRRVHACEQTEVRVARDRFQ